MNDKRGQFYLVAAMIIIAVIMGIFGVTNYIKKSNSAGSLDNLKEKLDIEISKNMEYAFEKGLTSEEMDTMWESFTEIEINNSDSKTNILFLFGNDNSTTAKGIQRDESGEIYIDTGSGKTLLKSGKGEYRESFTITGNTITITDGGEEHIYNIQKGQHFYYLLSKNIGKEREVIEG